MIRRTAVATLACLAMVLTACGGPSLDDSEERFDELRSETDAQLREVAPLIREADVQINRTEGQEGRVGLPPREGKRYQARVVLVPDPGDTKSEQAERVVRALESAGWRRLDGGDLTDADPAMQLERDDFQVKVEWQPRGGDFVVDIRKVGPDASVEFPEGAIAPGSSTPEPIELD
ncbi:hypothetical protein [Nocardioides sp.]|uniref:hypothetical protein n=1 Tax=Nocardioides sp. TaxID=35761 RepID=UPI00351780B9